MWERIPIKRENSMTKTQKAVVFVPVLIVAWLLHVTLCEWEFRAQHASTMNLLFGYQQEAQPGRLFLFTGLAAQPISGRSNQADARIYRLLVILVGVAMPIALVGADVYLLLGWRQAARTKRGLCPQCGYDLIGDGNRPANRCSECGWRRESEV